MYYALNACVDVVVHLEQASVATTLINKSQKVTPLRYTLTRSNSHIRTQAQGTRNATEWLVFRPTTVRSDMHISLN